MELLKNNDKREWDAQQWVEEFYAFLRGEIPEQIHLPRGHKPKMSQKQAHSVIWYLQEHFSIIPDTIEQCDFCFNFFDSNSEGGYWQTKGSVFVVRVVMKCRKITTRGNDHHRKNKRNHCRPFALRIHPTHKSPF